MAQPHPAFSSQRNFKHGDTRQERSGYKYHSGMMGASSTYHTINQNDKKSDVYVHRFNRIPSSSSNTFSRSDWRSGNQIHQNMYKHEFSDYYNTKAQYIKKQFNSLTLSPKTMHISPCKFVRSLNKYGSYEKQQNAKMSSPKIHKSSLFKPENKAVVDKLEETYWSKWKPNKDSQLRAMCPKTKGLYTENETIDVPQLPEPETRERGDSNEGIAIIPQKTEEIEDSCDSVQPTVSEAADSVEDEKIEEEIKILNLEEKDNSATTEPSLVSNNENVLIPESVSDCEVNKLQHTDSFILTSKKKSLEKSPFQQPKCIKLFKNSGYTSKAVTNYIKGGSYPLKSCLKKEKNESKMSCLAGYSVSPIRSYNRRPGRTNRFIW